MSSAVRTTSTHVSHVVDADDVCAARGTLAVTAAAVGPLALGGRDVADGRLQVRLARRADRLGTVERGQRSRRASVSQAVFRALGEADAGSTIDDSRLSPAAIARSSLAQFGRRPRDDVPVHRARGTCRSTARACASGSARRRSTRPPRPSAASYCSPLTSFTIVAPAATAARATAPCRCRWRWER